MATVAPPRTSWVRIVRDDGSAIEVPLTPALARQLDKMDAAERQRERRYRKRTRQLGDRDTALPEGTLLKRLASRPSATAWEGPHLSFHLFVGLSRIWDGPWPGQDPCPDCGGKRLGWETYCLGCDRCGCEGLIPRPTRAEMARFRQAQEAALLDASLAGGVGPRAGANGNGKH